MKIIVASAQFPPTRSGYARVAGNLAREYERAGHSVILLTEHMGCGRFGRVHRLTGEGRRILRQGADVVQVIGPSPLFTEQVVSAATHFRLPTVYKTDAFAGLSSYYSGRIPQIVDSLYVRTVLTRAMRMTDWTVFSTRDFAAAAVPRPAGSSVIPLGLSDPCLLRLHEKLPSLPSTGERPLAILFVGQLRPYKGVSYLLQAVRELHDLGFPNHVTIVGDGPSRAGLESLASHLNIESLVTFTGALGDAELHDEYLRHDVVVVPSLQAESFGLVLIEGGLHGLGAVASDLPGLREVTRDLGGIVVPPANSTALASVLQKMVPPRSSERRLNMDVAARYSWPVVAGQYLRLYARLLQGIR
jgi:glycosyltransferase involved in cell wall biosynthesis